VPKPNIPFSRDITHCHVYLQTRWPALLKLFREQTNKDLIITCTWRSEEEQHRLYKQGRTEPGKIVTNIDGYNKKLKAAGLLETKEFENGDRVGKRGTAFWWECINNVKVEIPTAKNALPTAKNALPTAQDAHPCAKDAPPPAKNAHNTISNTKDNTLDNDLSKDKSSNKSQKPEDVSQEVWEDFKKLRKGKRAAITETTIRGIRTEAEKIEWGLERALSEMCARGWQGFKSSWVNEGDTNGKIGNYRKTGNSERARAAAFAGFEITTGARQDHSG
jgi:hypothetical protein